MNPLLIAGVAAGGALVGSASGLLAVILERSEHLEDEERQERLEYEQQIEAAAARAREAGETPPDGRPWIGEKYGWTWLERWLSPAAGAAGFGAFAAHDPPGSGLAVHLLWVAVFVHIIGFDLKHRLILNLITYPSILLALVLAQWSPGLSLERSVIGAAGVALFFVAGNLLSGGGIGLGDAKLGALVGAVTGFAAVYAVAAAAFLGGAVAIVLLATRVRGRKDPIPYGPFLCAGAAIMLYVGP